MTDNLKTSATNLRQSEQKTSGCLTLCVTVFLVIIGAYWLITGEIIIPYKAVFVTGVPARIVAVLWIIFAMGLSFSDRSRSKNSLKQHGTQGSPEIKKANDLKSD